MNFEYSKEWYSNEYHAKQYGLPEKNLAQVMAEWDGSAHRVRFMQLMDRYDLTGMDCIEVGCHHGKSIVWALERYPEIRSFTGIDFSKTAIDWCNKHILSKYCQTWFELGDIRDMTFDDKSFDYTFFIDMIEHLPKDVYYDSIKEIKRITRPGGIIVILIGRTEAPEHINRMPALKAVDDFGLDLIDIVADRFHVMRNVYDKKSRRDADRDADENKRHALESGQVQEPD